MGGTAARGLGCWQALNVRLFRISLSHSLPLHFGPEAWEMERPSRLLKAMCGGTLLQFYIIHCSMIIIGQNQHLGGIDLEMNLEVSLLTETFRVWFRVISLSHKVGTVLFILCRGPVSLGSVCHCSVSRASYWQTTLAGLNKFFRATGICQ